VYPKRAQPTSESADRCGGQRGPGLATLDTISVRTYYVVMNLTLSLDDRVVKRARRKAQAMGKSLNQVVREYLERLAGSDDAERDVAELRRLSRESRGRVRGWRFDRDELHERP
jgi:Family of unknown function (DUF6364)